MDIVITIVEIIGTIAFSISGSVIAIKNKMDLLGVMVLGATTAVGGGFLRDIILNIDEINMFYNPMFVIIAVITSLIVFISFYFIKKHKTISKKLWDNVFNIIDAIGLGVFIVTGYGVACLYTNNMFLILFCSVLTAVGGGIIRDIFACKIPGVFRKHIYAIASIIGSFIYALLIDVNQSVAIFTTVSLVVLIRYLSFKYEWSLPKIQIG